MKNLSLKIVLTTILSLGLFCSQVSAHDNTIVHPELTDNAVNALDNSLINTYKLDIRQGSIDEDELIADWNDYVRPYAHAYDPINASGWFSGSLGSSMNARNKADDLWSKALTAWREGKLAGIDSAFYLLGRVSHLLEDMTSPAHTHADAHIPFIDPDDFEEWGMTNFVEIPGLSPEISHWTVGEYIARLSAFTYSKSSWNGIIEERTGTQPASTFTEMFPTIHYYDAGWLGDSYWHIDNIGYFERIVHTDAWWPCDGDFAEDNLGQGGARRILGSFYVENAAGDYEPLIPSKWEGTSNSKSLLSIWGEVLYPESVRYTAGLLKKFVDTVSSSETANLYFPHVDANLPWQTEIAIINTSDQPVSGTLRALSNAGELVESKAVTLSARGRSQITVAAEFADHTSIGYIVFDTNSPALQGYTKFYQAGKYRAAVPAVKAVNSPNIYISHIDSGALWWTGVSLVNTTSATKHLAITFNNGQSRLITLDANQHRAFDIAQEFFNNQPQPDIKSAVITNASGVIGLELFGNIGGSDHLDGILLTGNTTSAIYYPHVDSNGWWTGIVAYNPSASACTITIMPYSEQGIPLTSSTRLLEAKEKYVGVVADLSLPADTAWFKIDSTNPITGFELFGTADGNQLAAYAQGSGTGAKAGIFPKIENNGWTGIAFVNTEADTASVTLTAYNDAGTAVATRTLPVDGNAKVVNYAEALFPQDISTATYIAYSSDKNIVGFQLNGTADWMMLDGLPALPGAN